MLVSISLRIYLIVVNKTRDKKEGAAAAAAEEAAIPGKTQLTAVDYEDVTDFHTPGFRYRM